LKIQDGGSRHLENHEKTVIAEQQIDQSSPNLARRCKMGFLYIQSLKNLNFKIQDGGGRYFAISP